MLPAVSSAPGRHSSVPAHVIVIPRHSVHALPGIVLGCLYAQSGSEHGQLPFDHMQSGMIPEALDLLLAVPAPESDGTDHERHQEQRHYPGHG